jgi:hypothetical protein
MLVQQPHDVMMQPFPGNITGQPVHVVGDLAVREVVEQRLAGLVTALACCQKQWGLVLHHAAIESMTCTHFVK